ncbi:MULTISPECIES: SH3 domain-containing protein [Streptomycetaceae]|uniref:SH3b domain-containing protein n=1 Tax=Streptantibioticus cattleyicolor (strain ATCC 35852 / DSM 46488 / JCM 4925 / NBRC 14057 / NRRL 8057) TaxID=1003195 RepID=F8JTI8_STREN|nr:MULTISPECIES: SH3 domain-containing protein [Streptomycetaceae]AEW95550.1 hypothetical protein SCATT_31790 [Streptantibioticus cattleyicolor NRRL 8057 = DSM 46488]MYS60102.1 SH3 domain-containing protein [Streptomyces sp. SID5468]CCB75888.1 exported protein of unknown function [Streptantibioticus cattleyicolor NRRL 8057 = DSM 46488]
MLLQSTIGKVALAAVSGALVTAAVGGTAFATDHPGPHARPGANNTMAHPAKHAHGAMAGHQVSRPAAGHHSAMSGRMSSSAGHRMPARGHKMMAQGHKTTAKGDKLMAKGDKTAMNGRRMDPANGRKSDPMTGRDLYRGRVEAQKGLRIRNESRIGSRMLGSFRNGTMVELACRSKGSPVDRNDVWYRLGRHNSGWISGRFVRIVGSTPRLCQR